MPAGACMYCFQAPSCLQLLHTAESATLPSSFCPCHLKDTFRSGQSQQQQLNKQALFRSAKNFLRDNHGGTSAHGGRRASRRWRGHRRERLHRSTRSRGDHVQSHVDEVLRAMGFESPPNPEGRPTVRDHAASWWQSHRSAHDSCSNFLMMAVWWMSFKFIWVRFQQCW